MKKIKNMPESERPREKILNKSVQSLSNIELLAVILGKGCRDRDVLQIAKDILKLIDTQLMNLNIRSLCQINGVGIAKASQVLALFELAKRYFLPKSILVSNIHHVIELVSELKNKKQEYFITLTIDGAGQLIQKRTVFIGTLNESLIHPREVFADAIADRAASIIFVHNHPSGSINPTPEDKHTTQRLLQTAELVGINVLDHIIVSEKTYFSFLENGLLLPQSL